MQKIPMTVEGEAALRIELEKLKKDDRPTVIQAIAEAREHGDLKENAEYHAAREQQGEFRISSQSFPSVKWWIFLRCQRVIGLSLVQP
jgi:tRNA(Ile)-lysidine synthase TilS/MesJ